MNAINQNKIPTTINQNIQLYTIHTNHIAPTHAKYRGIKYIVKQEKHHIKCNPMVVCKLPNFHTCMIYS